MTGSGLQRLEATKMVEQDVKVCEQLDRVYPQLLRIRDRVIRSWILSWMEVGGRQLSCTDRRGQCRAMTAGLGRRSR